MEFHEKLQQLRRAKNMTQEQLAQQLYVSRTAVSKWESGRGYPNLESLKDISRLFCVSIDELLSNGELIELAETENRSNISKMMGMVFGVLDLITAAFIFMPLMGQQEGVYIRAVSLLEQTSISSGLQSLYLAALISISVLGVFEILMEVTDNEKGLRRCKTSSIALCAAAIVFFALSRQPYITAFLFLFFMVKVVLILRENRMN